jgi:hypothetical protein
MNKRSLIVMMLIGLLGFGMVLGCNNGTTTPPDDGTKDTRVIEAKYRGTWRTEDQNINGDKGWGVIVFYENGCMTGYQSKNVGLRDITRLEKSERFYMYTEGTELYAKDITSQAEHWGTFTSDSTFELKDGGWARVNENYYKE